MHALLPAAAFVTASYGATVWAKDLDLLARYLVPVFLSQDFSEACRAANPDYLRALPHGPKTIDELSQQTKKEITDKLTDDEAAMVVLVAANTALQAARHEMQTMAQNNSDLPFQKWCDEDAQPYILEVVRKNKQEHKTFLEIIARAKQ